MLPFIIILIGVILIAINLRLIKKENISEKSFSRILQKEELNNNKDYGIEIISIRKDLAETVMELQKEIEELRNYIKTIKNEEKIVDNNKKDNEIKNNNENSYPSSEEGVISEINFLKVRDDQHINKNVSLKEDKDIKNSNNIDNLYNDNKLIDNKIRKVKNLLEKGLSEEEICSELSIGRGEVLLIKNLLIK